MWMIKKYEVNCAEGAEILDDRDKYLVSVGKRDVSLNTAEFYTMKLKV